MKLFFFCVLFAMCFLHCTKNSAGSDAVTVYVAGSNLQGAVLWKNSVGYPLDGLLATSLAVSPYAEYVAGHSLDGAKFWKSGKPVSLIDTSGRTTTPNGYFPNSISTNGHDIYAAGYMRDGSKYVAMYWKNGQPVRVTDDTTHSTIAECIVVTDNNIAVLGFVDGNPNYWLNGVSHSLGQGLSATGLALSGNDVYVSGYDGKSLYWKNGNRQSLEDSLQFSSATSIFVSGTDVYVAGFGEGSNYTMYALYWKNGNLYTLGPGQAFSIAVLGNNVYVAGHLSGTNGGNAFYYKNDQLVNLGNSDGSAAYAISVLSVK
jgi:hypothetical protein